MAAHKQEDQTMATVHQDQKALLARIAELEAANAALKAQGERRMALKVSEKGAITSTGVRGKWGATYYVNEWERILSMKDAILKFAAEHKAELSTLDKLNGNGQH
jgi:hypothetical protein